MYTVKTCGPDLAPRHYHATTIDACRCLAYDLSNRGQVVTSWEHDGAVLPLFDLASPTQNTIELECDYPGCRESLRSFSEKSDAILAYAQARGWRLISQGDREHRCPEHA